MNREDMLFVKLLKKNGFSLTSPRKQLFVLLKSGNAVTINELTSILPFNRSTVYRALELFQKLGIVVEAHIGWKHKYELSDIFQHHHHHLTCARCGRVITLKESKTLEAEIARLATRSHFKTTDHQLEIRGICDKCHKS